MLGAPYRSKEVTAVSTIAARAPPRPNRAHQRAVVGLTVALWASAFVAIRYADRELSPPARSRSAGFSWGASPSACWS